MGTKMTVSNLSLLVVENIIIIKLNELDELLQSQQAEMEGLRDAFINYIAVSGEIIEELGRAE